MQGRVRAGGVGGELGDLGQRRRDRVERGRLEARDGGEAVRGGVQAGDGRLPVGRERPLQRPATELAGVAVCRRVVARGFEQAPVGRELAEHRQQELLVAGELGGGGPQGGGELLEVEGRVEQGVVEAGEHGQVRLAAIARVEGEQGAAERQPPLVSVVCCPRLRRLVHHRSGGSAVTCRP